jgi:hypothetical protein
VQVLIDQAQKITLTSRAFYNDQFGPYAEYTTDLFGYDKVKFVGFSVSLLSCVDRVAMVFCEGV